MKSIFDRPSREALIRRIHTLTENNKAQWGKMTVSQMVQHCIRFEEMIQGKRSCKRSLIGRVIGQWALKGFMKESLLKRNMPTSPELVIKQVNVPLTEKEQWIILLEEYECFDNHLFIHPFFGKMTKEQVGFLAYKHTDHHLRQFNA